MSTVNDEDTKIQSLSDNEEDVMQNLFYIYFEHKITGPFKPEDILTLYITSKIDKEIWIKRADSMKEWVSVKLEAASTDQKEKENENENGSEENKTFKKAFPKLHDYLMPKLKVYATKRIEAPLDVPGDAVKKLSTGRRIIKWIGYVLLVAATMVLCIHVFPFLCFSCCFFLGGILCFDKDDDETLLLRLFAFSMVTTSLGLIIVPFIIVYIVLLGEVDADYWDGEIQSWMIGYIAWGICSFLLMLPIPLLAVLYDYTSSEMIQRTVDRFFAAEFWILGVSFGSISIRGLMDSSNGLALMIVFIFPACAAVLPSFIIGFIANFALEEKFELKCNDTIANIGTNLCSDDNSGCCEIISSHDISNMYTFVGGLASNILATWAVIRICGYFLVAASHEASVFAKRNK